MNIITKLFTTYRLRKIKNRYNKLITDAHYRYEQSKQDALAFQLEEIDRRLERSDETINYFNENVKH